MNEHETIADIIAEKRLQADEMEKTLAQIDQSLDRRMFYYPALNTEEGDTK